MEYSIGQVADILGLTAHTLRYYDKEGLLPDVRKNSAGIRRFTERDVNHLVLLECLKSTGLQLKEIKHYFDLCRRGDETLCERQQLFIRQKQRLSKQMEELKKNVERLDFKLKYYEEALKNGETGIYERNPQLKREKERLFN